MESLNYSKPVLGFRFLNVSGIAAAPYESKKKNESENTPANPVADK